MYSYNITTRVFSRNSSVLAKPVDDGPPYSGTLQGRNNPSMTSTPHIGPLPVGRYRIAPSRDSATLGPVVFDLLPFVATNTFGRSLFRIHGNDKQNDASHGCLILNRDIRESIAKIVDRVPLANSDDNVLEVVAV